MRPRRLLTALLLTLVMGMAGPRTRGDEAGPPLTNEDVVRMVAAGRPEEEILRIIAASKVDFELDREMTEALTHAGVPERILAAMRERQAVAGTRPLPVAPAAEPSGAVELTFVPLEKHEASRGRAATFQVIRRTPRWAAQHLGVEQKAEVEDLALFVACTTPDHVPDHWQDRTKIPDFLRHELLWFKPGSRPGKAKGFEVLSLDLPASLKVELAAGAHTLVVGVALRIGSAWHVSSSDSRRGVPVVAGRATAIQVKVSGRIVGTSMTGFSEEQDLAIGDVTPPQGAS